MQTRRGQLKYDRTCTFIVDQCSTHLDLQLQGILENLGQVRRWNRDSILLAAGVYTVGSAHRPSSLYF
jgi:hypothetical protein